MERIGTTIDLPPEIGTILNAIYYCKMSLNESNCFSSDTNVRFSKTFTISACGENLEFPISVVSDFSRKVRKILLSDACCSQMDLSIPIDGSKNELIRQLYLAIKRSSFEVGQWMASVSIFSELECEKFVQFQFSRDALNFFKGYSNFNDVLNFLASNFYRLQQDTLLSISAPMLAKILSLQTIKLESEGTLFGIAMRIFCSNALESIQVFSQILFEFITSDCAVIFAQRVGYQRITSSLFNSIRRRLTCNIYFEKQETDRYISIYNSEATVNILKIRDTIKEKSNYIRKLREEKRAMLNMLKGKHFFPLFGFNRSNFPIIFDPSSATSIVIGVENGFSGPILIPEGVSKIGKGAFRASGITSIRLPRSLKEIRESAFRECKLLKSIRFFNEIELIGASAFRKCSSLSGVFIVPENTTIIGDDTFRGCSSISCIKLSKNVKSIGKHAFCDCVSLSDEFIVPESVTAIEEAAFFNCYSLKFIRLPNCLTSIGDYAFSNCYSLCGDFIVPRSVAEICDRAFFNCSSLSTIRISRELQKNL